jgi:hypothetical protein
VANFARDDGHATLASLDIRRPNPEVLLLTSSQTWRKKGLRI